MNTNKTQLDGMIQDALEFVKSKCNSLANSGGIDPDEPFFNKAILSSALEEASWQFRPLTSEGKAAVQNLKHF